MFRFDLRLMVAYAALSANLAMAQFRHEVLDGPNPPSPRKVIVIPAEIRVQELSAGGILTQVPQLTEQASKGLSGSMRSYLSGSKALEVVQDTPAMSSEEKEQLEDYLATFYVVGVTAFNITNYGGSAWQHKRKKFDYSLGQGLSFLRDKTGADAALMIVGEDIVSSGGRKAAAFLGALVGVGIPMGRSVVFVAMVDLKTGNLLWVNSTQSGFKDLSDTDSSASMSKELLEPYPKGR